MKRAMILAVMAALCASPAAGQSIFDRIEKATGGINKQLGIGTSAGTGALGTDEITRGLKEALKLGTERLTGKLGVVDGFNADPDIHIPLPESLKRVQSVMERFGLSDMADDLETKLNRAAEEATPKAKKLFWDAISQMSLSDARKILDGPKDAATQYFRGRMSDPLKAEFRPVVDRSLNEVGAVKAYDSLMADYKALPFVPDVKADLVNHVLDRAIAGIFLYLGREEAAIRENPAKRTTELLKRVFGT